MSTAVKCSTPTPTSLSCITRLHTPLACCQSILIAGQQTVPAENHSCQTGLMNILSCGSLDLLQPGFDLHCRPPWAVMHQGCLVKARYPLALPLTMYRITQRLCTWPPHNVLAATMSPGCRGLSMDLLALEEMQTSRLAAEAERRDLVMQLAQQEGATASLLTCSCHCHFVCCA